MNRFIALVLLVVVAGCATDLDQLEWPEGAYPRSYFIAAYQEDVLAQQYQTLDDYLLWVSRFYNGYTVAPGWLNLQNQVLERLDDPQSAYAAEVMERLYHLGGRIGAEWSKSNEVRVLDTRNAAVWRDALIESINQSDLDGYMSRVEADVEMLFTGELDREDIYFERYYIDEFD